mmetsp:Transcript_31812/g.31223  ORF Transcript_31812/g.31223 Transcript_31812/m.31223 type:complete len:187 (+) Transcript_31812:1162-1722(+)
MNKRFDNINDTFTSYEKTTIQPVQAREARLYHIECKLKEFEEGHGRDLEFLKKLTRKLLYTLDQSMHKNNDIKLVKLVHKYKPEEEPEVGEDNRLSNIKLTSGRDASCSKKTIATSLRYDANRSAIQPTGDSFLPSLTRNVSPLAHNSGIYSNEHNISGCRADERDYMASKVPKSWLGGSSTSKLI